MNSRSLWDLWIFFIIWAKALQTPGSLLRFLRAAPFFFLVLFSCNAGEKVKFETRDLVIAAGSGEIAINAEIARSDLQREQGLMFRKSLDDGKGMLFVFERDQILSFWMKNTLIPLSIAFIASDGRILEIHDMESQNLNPVKSSRSARYALEVPQGWFGRVGIKSGDRLATSSL